MLYSKCNSEETKSYDKARDNLVEIIYNHKLTI